MFNNDIEVLLKAKDGDKEAMSKLLDENVGLIWNIVKKFSGRGYETEDLFQIGCMGFVKAIKKFNLEYNVQLSTYVFPVVLGEIKRFLRDDGIIKVSRSSKELYIKIQEFEKNFLLKNNREATLEEISSELKIPKEEIIFALEASQKPESIYKQVNDEESNQMLLDKISSFQNEAEIIAMRMTLSKLISELNEREKQIILLRFFKDKTQSDVAKIIGVSQVQVSRIESKVLERMRDKIA